MTSRLSELAGCTATAEEFFPSALGSVLSSRERTIAGAAPDNLDSLLGVQLICLLQQVESATTQAKRLVFGRHQEQLSTRVTPDSWSPAECLEHLALTTRAFVPAIAGVMAKAPRLTRNRVLRADTLARVLIRTLEPPYRLRHKVLAHLAPKRHDFSAAWADFLESQEQLGQIIRSAAGLAIDTVKIQSPMCCA